ncbi:shikimate kinase [Flavicella sediminum]|uniref:shikimate kinase n=1 Tax=Flavicella sediminum TaxID=2585141 RepID=UPI00111DEC6F|nr:shikimate kinase [Flavicella sediminum]
MKIVFVGYMASGKSAVAKSLKSALNVELIDLDAYIEEKEAQTITSIFKNKGEVYFRQKESFYLKELLERNDDFILSVGGGTPCLTGNMELINKKATSIYLKAAIDTIYNRIIHEKANRPLVANIADENLKEFIAKHLFERALFYEQAQLIVSVNDKSIEEISKEIVEKLA